MSKVFLTLANLLLIVGQALAIDVYIPMGQSNAVGGAWPPYPPAEMDNQAAPYYYRLRTSLTNVLDPPEMDHVRGLWPSFPWNVSFGPELSFAYEMERRSGSPVAIIKVAENGSGLENRWLPSISGGIYSEAIAKIQASLADMTLQGLNPQVKGILWIQGETDAGNGSASRYEENLNTFISSLRQDLGDPTLPFYFNLLNSQVGGDSSIVRLEQKAYDNSDPYAFSFDPSHIQLNADATHYGNSGHIDLGRMYANLISPSGDFNFDGSIDGADFLKWQSSYGSTFGADGNSDGIVDEADLALWYQGINHVQPTVATVPEPTAAAIVTFFIIVGVLSRGFKSLGKASRRHKRHRASVSHRRRFKTYAGDGGHPDGVSFWKE